MKAITNPAIEAKYKLITRSKRLHLPGYGDVDIRKISLAQADIIAARYPGLLELKTPEPALEKKVAPDKK